MAERRTTTCNRDCPDACRIVATVEEGRVTQLQGDPDHPITQGFLCHRTNQFLNLQYGRQRVLAPHLRRDGRLEPVGWDEALDHIAAELLRIRDQWGPEAIFHYQSGGTLGALTSEVTKTFFDHFGPVTEKRGDICSGAGEAAQELDFGVSDSSALEHLEVAKHIILWGKNVVTSSPHTMVVLKRAHEKGTGLTLVDPLHHASARLCDTFIQPRPGTDFALAMAVGTILFDRGWIAPEAPLRCRDLDRFEALCRSRPVDAWCAAADVAVAEAELLAERLHDGPTAILVGWGLARRQNGGTTVRALDALGAITGNVGIPGGGVSYYFQRRRSFRRLPRREPARTIPEPLFGPAVLATNDPPIRAIWVTAGNPAAMLPDSQAVAAALEEQELVVVVDPLWTDTGRLADVVLPCETLLESSDLLGAYGHQYVAASTGVVDPPPQVRSELWIFQQLAERLGFGAELAGTRAAWLDRLLGDDLREAEISVADLAARAERSPSAPGVVFADGTFPTDDGRAHLLTGDDVAALTALLPSPPEDRPLMLLSVSTPKSQSAQWAKAPPKRAVATVHPDAAGGITDGGEGQLRSPRGTMRVVVRHDRKQRRDVVQVPKGGWPSRGTSANVLLTAALTDLGEGGALYDEWVALEPLTP